jgi:hypothetical protein
MKIGRPFYSSWVISSSSPALSVFHGLNKKLLDALLGSWWRTWGPSICPTQFWSKNQILIVCVPRNNISIHTDISDYSNAKYHKQSTIIIWINVFKRLNDSHQSSIADDSIIHRKHNRGSASLELLIEEFHFSQLQRRSSAVVQNCHQLQYLSRCW